MAAISDAPTARDRAIQWMNRGHVLSLRGAGVEALEAYAHAIALLRPLPLARYPAWANSLGAALMNYGQLLHRVHGTGRSDLALRAYAEGISVLERVSPANLPWARRNLAGTLLNRANLWLDLGQLPAAIADARGALQTMMPLEHEHLVDAELALKARRALCDAIGQQLAIVSTAQQEQLADETSDTVDAALALIRFWIARDASAAAAFGPLAERFFRFGCELYRRHQPHFLVEFIEENLATAPALAEGLRVIAHLALDAALADGAAPGLHLFDDPATLRALATRAELAAARSHLPAGDCDSGLGAASAAIEIPVAHDRG